LELDMKNPIRNHYAIFVFAAISGIVNLLAGLVASPLALSMRCDALSLLSFGAMGLLFILREELPPVRTMTQRARIGFMLGSFVFGMLAVFVDGAGFHSLDILASFGLAVFGSMLFFLALNARPTTVAT
jgi:hypothetical protein